MITQAGARDRTVLAVGGIVIALVLLVGRGTPFVVQEHARRVNHADLLLGEVRQRENATQDEAHLRQTLRRIRATVGGYDSALVSIGTPALASARLAEVVDEAARASEARIGAVQLSIDSTDVHASLMRVRAHATVNGDLTSIALVIQALEAGPPMLAVRELTITRVQAPSATGQPETLQAELTVEGLAQRAIPGANR